MTSTKFSSRGFDLSKFISKSILPNDVFALFSKEFAKAVPDDADITQSRGQVSARVGNRELVLTVVELEKEDGIEEILNQIGVTTRNSNGTIKTMNEVLEEIAEVWRYL